MPKMKARMVSSSRWGRVSTQDSGSTPAGWPTRTVFCKSFQPRSQVWAMWVMMAPR